MSDLVEAISNRMLAEAKKSGGLMFGVVTAISLPTVTVTVTVNGSSIANVRCLGNYYPVVNDLVEVAYILDQFIVQQAISKNLTKPTTTDTQPPDPTPPPAPTAGTVVVAPDAVFSNSYGYTHTNGSSEAAAWGAWVSDRATQGRVTSSSSYTTPEYGYWDPTLMEWVVVVPETTTTTTTRYDYGALAVIPRPALPGGATITSAKLRVTRSASDGGPALVSPVLYGHTLAGSPAGALTGYLSGALWKPGTLAKGQTARWDLPSGWITAFMAGTLKGFGVWSNASIDASEYEAASISELTINYTYTP